MCTCCAFSVSYPFRKGFWTNKAFILSVIAIFLVDCLFLVLPTSSFLSKFFNVMPYTGDQMYKLNVISGILLCTIMTFVSEKMIAVYFTKVCDRRVEEKKR